MLAAARPAAVKASIGQPNHLGRERSVEPEGAGLPQSPTPRELLTDSLKERVGASHIRALGHSRVAPGGVEVRPHRFGLGEHVDERHVPTLDREQAFPQRTGDLELRVAGPKPGGRGGEQSEQVVGVLRAKLARQLEVVRALPCKPGERREIAGGEQTLIGEGSVELLHVLLRLVDGVGLGGERSTRCLGEAGGHVFER